MSGQVVAVLGSVRIDGEVSRAGGRGARDRGARTARDRARRCGHRRRAAAESPWRAGGRQRDRSVARRRGRERQHPWMHGWGPFHFGGFGPVTRLIGTTFRFVLLVIVACLALVVARRAVEGSAQRVARRTGAVDARRPRRVGAVRAGVRAHRRRAVDFDRRDSAAAPDAVCGAVPAADGDRRIQRHGQRGRSVGAAAIRASGRRPGLPTSAWGS